MPPRRLPHGQTWLGFVPLTRLQWKRALNESDFDPSGKLRQRIPLRRIKTGLRRKPVTLLSF